jgi:hypothetical protein
MRLRASARSASRSASGTVSGKLSNGFQFTLFSGASWTCSFIETGTSRMGTAGRIHPVSLPRSMSAIV